MVACAILVSMMAAAMLIYSSGLNRMRKQDNTSESYRAAMTAVAHIRSQLRGSQLLAPGTGSGPQPQAVYRYPKMVGDLPRVDSQGMIIWHSPATFRCDAGILTRTGSEDRQFCNLGAGGSVTFERLDRRLLRLVVIADKPSLDVRKSSHYEARADVYLPNN